LAIRVIRSSVIAALTFLLDRLSRIAKPVGVLFMSLAAHQHQPKSFIGE